MAIKKVEIYDKAKRIKSGLKRLVKVAIPLIPQIIEWVSSVNVPYKETIMVSLAFIIALEKSLQKDKNLVK